MESRHSYTSKGLNRAAASVAACISFHGLCQCKSAGSSVDVSCLWVASSKHPSLARLLAYYSCSSVKTHAWLTGI